MAESLTGRTHLPPRLFKEAARLNRQKDQLTQLLSEINPMNAKAKSKAIAALLDDYIPGVEVLMTRLKKTSKAAKKMHEEIAELKKAVDHNKTSTLHLLELEKKVQEMDNLRHLVESLQKMMDTVPKEILAAYRENESIEKGGPCR